MSTLAAEAVDLVHLDRYTGGDRSLNEEVLRLFDSQCAELIGSLNEAAEAADPKLWHLVTHTLKGAARGIGAHALAATAAQAEKVDVADRAARDTSVARVRHCMADVQRFIARYLARAA